jgi:dihydropyrimidinase
VPRYDLLVQGGTLVDDRSARPGDIAVADGRIAAVTAPGELSADDADELIPADGALVIPGGIDAHVHLDFAIGPWVSQQYDVGSRAALHGGTTTIIDFAVRYPGKGSLLEAVASKRADAEAGICCDFALHLIVMGEVGDAELAEIEGVIAAGVPTVKVFMNFPDFYPGDGATAELFAEVGRVGGTAVVHAENLDIIATRTRRLIEAGKSDWRFNDDSRPDWVEAEAVERAIRICEAGNCPLFVFHVTSAAAARAIRDAQARGLPVFSETCHNYVVFSKDDVVERPNGADWGNMPPLRPPWNREELWRALEERVIEHVSTDDYTGPLSDRNKAGVELPTLPAGHNGVETRLAVLYTEAVVKRGWPLERFVDIAGGGIARRLGLWPRKGSLLPGADADLVVFDPARSGTFHHEQLHTVDYSIWDGYEYAGLPQVTILRGVPMVRGGEFEGPEGVGRFLHRPAGPLGSATPI